jgi:hypothetical protein
MAKLINLTPHTVNIVKNDNSIISFPPSGTIARVFSDYVKRGTVNDIDVVDVVYGDVIDLPPPRKDIVYIVSRMVLNAAPNRRDLVVPHDLVRNPDGSVKGARCFARGD